MTKTQIQAILEKVDAREFASGAHTSQHRMLGFITTNIRTAKSIAEYIVNLLPEYITRKTDLDAWENWSIDPTVSNDHKQKFRRLEVAKILFRKIKDSPALNEIGEKLYRISQQDEGEKYLTFILNLYLLTGRYFDVDNQPLVEIEKILALYKGNIVQDSIAVLRDGEENRLLFASIFYNPAVPEALDLAYELLENDQFSQDGLDYLKEQIADNTSLIRKRTGISGGVGNFRSDIAVILNYHLFKTSAQKHADSINYDELISEYIESVFSTGLNEYFGLNDKEALFAVLLDSKNRNILKDIVEFALGVKFDNSFVRKPERKNIKQAALENYGYKCFYDCHAENDDEILAHTLNYFKTKKDETYLEGHHMVQMENSKFFNNDLDVVENIIPVCPNCHRKLHNAGPKIVMKMLKTYYDNTDKGIRMRKGIFVDIDTLSKFYGIEG